MLQAKRCHPSPHFSPRLVAGARSATRDAVEGGSRAGSMTRGPKSHAGVIGYTARMDVKQLKEEICAAVDAMRDELLRVAQAIHAKPELAFQEHEAAALLVGLLREAGLEVSQGVYGLETAFAAEFGPEQGPCVALLAEYDALPQIGHACGHNLIAASGVGAGLALAGLG